MFSLLKRNIQSKKKQTSVDWFGRVPPSVCNSNVFNNQHRSFLPSQSMLGVMLCTFSLGKFSMYRLYLRFWEEMGVNDDLQSEAS
ncbi:hypothetical protein LR48_Vigan2328s000100 [Vigna angularis]|nr:hypothetical protein LR48_Vigan2328s000100 [Vigna angularis]